jgi:hypothetical protein
MHAMAPTRHCFSCFFSNNKNIQKTADDEAEQRKNNSFHERAL